MPNSVFSNRLLPLPTPAAWREELGLGAAATANNAAGIPSTAVGLIAATNVQAAIAELEAEKSPRVVFTQRDLDILAELPVDELRSLLGEATGSEIDAWAEDNTNTPPKLRAAFRTLLKLLAAATRL